MKHLVFLCLIATSLVACHNREHQKCISGIKWIGERINGKRIHFQEQNQKIYMEFDTLNRVTGRAGCNRFTGVYNVNRDGKVVISNIVTTKLTSPDMHIEAIFFKALENTDSFIIRRNQLRLKGEGNIVAIFSAEET